MQGTCVKYTGCWCDTVHRVADSNHPRTAVTYRRCVPAFALDSIQSHVAIQTRSVVSLDLRSATADGLACGARAIVESFLAAGAHADSSERAIATLACNPVQSGLTLCTPSDAHNLNLQAHIIFTRFPKHDTH